LEKDVQFKKSNGFERYEFVHSSLPDVSLSEIETSVVFMGKKFRLPFLIEALTGGAQNTEGINSNLASAAQEVGIGMGLGSQRAMLEDKGMAYTYYVRAAAPDIFLLDNLGGAQLRKYACKEIEKAVQDIGVDGLAIHLNVLQELCQAEGDTDWKNVLEKIAEICNRANFPVILKETGSGISHQTAKDLLSAGASCLDVAGAGGTCMPKVEYFRGAEIAKSFFEWGIPTAESLRDCLDTVDIPIIASGGIRSGLECAKAIAMGASLVGFASPS